MHGQRGVKVVALRGLKSKKRQEITVRFGDKPWNPAGMVPVSPYETWLRYQAQSVLGRAVSLSEAEELFKTIDIDTRQPKQSAAGLSWWQRLISKVN